MSVEPLIFTREQLLQSHEYIREHKEAGHTLHGGFVATGEYVPPRTLVRWPAIRAWEGRLTAQGAPLLDCSRARLRGDNYPNREQQNLLLHHGLEQTLWDSLTIIGVIEAKGEGMCYVPKIDFQSIIEEDISGTTVGHLYKGLFWAHGIDEAGDPENKHLGGHDEMWFACRDTLLGANAYPRPEIPQTFKRPGDAEREVPEIPAPHERLIKSLMNILLLELRAYSFFEFCCDVFRDPGNFKDRAAQASLAATIVERVREDEGAHIGYLQMALSELRAFTFKLIDGSRVPGATIIDPLWKRVTAWPDDEAASLARKTTRDRVKSQVEAKFDPDTAQKIMAEFDDLASPLPAD